MFDRADEQAAYAERYIPPELLSTRAGKKLVTRICLWCRGRFVIYFLLLRWFTDSHIRSYRTTAMIINCLLLSRFVNPHTVLTACVASFAMIEPSDSPVEMNEEVRARCHRLVCGLGGFQPSRTFRHGEHPVHEFGLWMTFHRRSSAALCIYGHTSNSRPGRRSCPIH